MSGVTLETLLADFESARSHWEQHGIWEEEDGSIVTPPTGLSPCFIMSHTDDGSDLADIDDTFDDLERAARLYLIARDEGLNAAMLYKLSDGAQDQREVRSDA